MKKIILLIGFFPLLISQFSNAAPQIPPYQLRLSYGTSNIDPTQVNTDLKAKNIEELKTASRFGGEANLEVLDFLRFGIAYTRRVKDFSSSDKKVNLDVETYSVLGRVGLYKTDIVMLDVFAGLGLMTGEYKQQGVVSADNVVITNRGANDKSSLYTNYGASLALGYKKFFLFAEGGIEKMTMDATNKVGTFKSEIKDIDLSGQYLVFGIVFYDTLKTGGK